MSARWSALLVWALAAAVAVAWALRLFVPATPVPAQARVADTAAPLAGDLTRLLGAPPVVPVAAVAPPPEAATRFQLTGVVATRREAANGAAGVAIIAFDGKPPRAYRVGDGFEGGQYALASVGLRSARIEPRGGGAGFTLELPPPQAAATGVPAGLSTPPPIAGAPAVMVPPAVVPALPPTATPGVLSGPPPGAMPPGAVPPGMPAPQPQDARGNRDTVQ